MAFLPFYFPRHSSPPHVVIIGAGYAGLAALITLRRIAPDVRLTLVEPSNAHLKITRLHALFHDTPPTLRLPLSRLADRFQFQHVQAALDLSSEMLFTWAETRCVTGADFQIPFDYLIVAAGAGPVAAGTTNETWSLSDLLGDDAVDRLLRQLDCNGTAAQSNLSIIGGGPTGLQFACAIDEALKRRKIDCVIRLIDGGTRVLAAFPDAMARYATAKLQSAGIEWLGGSRFIDQAEGQVIVEDKASGQRSALPSNVSLLCIGKPRQNPIEANAFGQILLNGRVQPRLFAAGDGTVFRGPGSNSQSAQTALRKGKLVARNVLRHSGCLKLLEPYWFRELGYVVDLGADDAIGWLGTTANVIAGKPALAVKELVDAQYDLLLAGVDVYPI